MDLSRLEWIASTREEPFDPERRIVDPHHHLWDRGDMGRYLLDDLLRDTGSGHNVTNTVFMECGSGYRDTGPESLRPVGETEFVAAQAAAAEQRGGSRISGIVSCADLDLGDAVDEVLEAHEAAGNGLFRGIRHGTAWDADPRLHSREPRGLMTQERFQRGVARLGARGCSFDAWIYAPQLGELAALARAADATTIVINHLGMPLYVRSPGDRDGVRAEWRQGMSGAASCPNVVVKLGGVGMDYTFGTEWTSRPQPVGSDVIVDWWGEDFRWIIDEFGPSRCMFESNYPVDRNSVGYTVLWNAYQKIASSYADDEQDELFSGTASRVYRVS